jgi:hypothetical protein
MFLKWVGFEYLVWAQNFRALGPEFEVWLRHVQSHFVAVSQMWLGSGSPPWAGNANRVPIVRDRAPLDSQDRGSQSLDREASLIGEIKVA